MELESLIIFKLKKHEKNTQYGAYIGILHSVCPDTYRDFMESRFHEAKELIIDKETKEKGYTYLAEQKHPVPRNGLHNLFLYDFYLTILSYTGCELTHYPVISIVGNYKMDSTVLGNYILSSGSFRFRPDDAVLFRGKGLQQLVFVEQDTNSQKAAVLKKKLKNYQYTFLLNGMHHLEKSAEPLQEVRDLERACCSVLFSITCEQANTPSRLTQYTEKRIRSAFRNISRTLVAQKNI